MNRIKSIITAPLRFFMALRLGVQIVIVLGFLGLCGVGAVELTSETGFCDSCHIMNNYYASWKTSPHSQVNCLNCHLQPGFTGLIKGKLNGLAQLVDCAVGREGTKPSATVLDESCLRPECHSIAKLTNDKRDYHGIKFTHTGHINQVIDGITMTCGTCHSHFKGTEHFSVNKEACFTCHFLGGDTSDRRAVQVRCQRCHEVPDKVIRRGLVEINHKEFVSYQANCETSCHRNEVVHVSPVKDTTCLSCHDYGMDPNYSVEKLHKEHTGQEKVECFSCHGEVHHGQTNVLSVTAMMDCQSCHSDTHQVQRSIYGMQHPTGPDDSDRVLSPMFLTHVQCTGCHVNRVSRSKGALDSFGTVALASPAGCDSCHEPGTGDKYIPFWQKQIKALYQQVDQRIKQLEDRAQVRQSERQTLLDKTARARVILDSVQSDGSWGVHNFKYTESLLLEAKRIVAD